MNRQLDISIIIINYNGLQETCELIESLQQFLHKCLYEIIVIDNGSIQNETVILQKKYPQILAIRSEQNLGFSGGNNLGIRVAKEMHFLINNDTFVTDDSLIYLYKETHEFSCNRSL